jgi:hypothetical protein
MRTTNRANELFARTLQAAGSLAKGAEPAEELGPGDVVVLELPEGPGRSLGLEWLLVERSADRRFLVVPLDRDPRVGVRDLGLEMAESLAGGDLGPCTVRCGHRFWVAETALGNGLKSGLKNGLKNGLKVASVRPEVVAAVAQHIAAIESQSLVPSLLKDETEQEPDYVQLQGAVADAVRIVARRAAEVAHGDRAGVASFEHPQPGGGAGRQFDGRATAFRWWLAAAAVLLMAGNVVLVVSLQNARRERDLEQQRAERIVAATEQEREQLEARVVELAASIAQTQRAGEVRERELEDEIERLRSSARTASKSETGSARLVFFPDLGTVRSGSEVLELSQSDRQLVLVLEVAEAGVPDGEGYVVELWREGELATPPISAVKRTLAAAGVVTVVVSSELLPGGDYEIVVKRGAADAARRLSLTIVRR